MDQRPDEKCPWGRCDIRLFAVGVHALRDGGYVQAKVEEIDEYVQDLEQNTISPRVGHDGLIDKS